MFKQIVKIAKSFIAINVNSLSTVIQKQWLRQNNYDDYKAVPQERKNDLNNFIQNKKKQIKKQIDDQVSNQMYKNWIYQILMKGQQGLQDVQKLITETKKLGICVKHLQAINNQLEQSGQQTIKKQQLDIKYFANYGQLHKFLSNYYDIIQRSEQKQNIKKINPSDVFPFVVKIGKYSLYKISKKQEKDFQRIYGMYGYDTGWCVAQATVPFDYYQKGMEYYYLITIQKKPFALLSLDDFQFKDVHDDAINVYDDDLIKLMDYIFQKQHIDYDQQFDNSDLNDLKAYFIYKQFKYNDFKQQHNRFLMKKNGYQLYQNLMLEGSYVITKDKKFLNTFTDDFSVLTILNGDFNQQMFDLYVQYMTNYLQNSYFQIYMIHIIKNVQQYNVNTSYAQNKLIDFFIKNRETDISNLQQLIYKKDNNIDSQHKQNLIKYLIHLRGWFQLESLYDRTYDQQFKNIMLKYYIPNDVSEQMLLKIHNQPTENNLEKCIDILKEKDCKNIAGLSYSLLNYADNISDENIKYLIQNCYINYLDIYNIKNLMQQIKSKHKIDLICYYMIEKNVYQITYFFKYLNEIQQQNVIKMLVKGIKQNRIYNFDIILQTVYLIKKQQDIKQIVDALYANHYAKIYKELQYDILRQNPIFDLLFLQKCVSDGYGLLVLNKEGLLSIQFDKTQFIKYCLNNQYSQKDAVLKEIIKYNDFFGQESQKLMTEYFITHGKVDLASELVYNIDYKYRKDLAYFILDNFQSVDNLDKAIFGYRQKSFILKVIQVLKQHQNQPQFKQFIEHAIDENNSLFLDKDIYQMFKQNFSK